MRRAPAQFDDVRAWKDYTAEELKEFKVPAWYKVVYYLLYIKDLTPYKDQTRKSWIFDDALEIGLKQTTAEAILRKLRQEFVADMKERSAKSGTLFYSQETIVIDMKLNTWTFKSEFLRYLSEIDSGKKMLKIYNAQRRAYR